MLTAPTPCRNGPARVQCKCSTRVQRVVLGSSFLYRTAHLLCYCTKTRARRAWQNRRFQECSPESSHAVIPALREAQHAPPESACCLFPMSSSSRTRNTAEYSVPPRSRGPPTEKRARGQYRRFGRGAVLVGGGLYRVIDPRGTRCRTFLSWSAPFTRAARAIKVRAMFCMCHSPPTPSQQSVRYYGLP